MTPLRNKMIRELELRRKAPGTIHQYVHAVADLAGYYGRPPDKISYEEVRGYLHHLLIQRKLAASTCNGKVVALRFFYREVLGQKDLELNVRCKRPGKLPEPLSRPLQIICSKRASACRSFRSYWGTTISRPP